jgi:hypothetical protein
MAGLGLQPKGGKCARARLFILSAVEFGVEVSVAKRGRCSKPLTPKSRFRAEEAQHDGTLILLEGTLQCECGARVGARFSLAGGLIPPRHRERDASSFPRVPSPERAPQLRRQ